MTKVVTIPASQVGLALTWLRRNNITFKLNQNKVTTVTLADADAVKFSKVLPTLKPVAKPVVAKPIVKEVAKPVAPVKPATKTVVTTATKAPVKAEAPKSKFSFKKFW
jgi:septal ring-binding cell division protein DamX